MIKIEILFDEGDPGDKLFIIIEGKVQIYRQSYSNNDKDPVILSILKMGIILERWLSSNLINIAPPMLKHWNKVISIRYKKADFDQFLERYPKVCFNFTKCCIE